jgi:hypothetical protein
MSKLPSRAESIRAATFIIVSRPERNVYTNQAVIRMLHYQAGFQGI